MELEEMKQKWSLLSERLDRTEVFRRRDMECLFRRRAGSYLHYMWFVELSGFAALPLIVAIGKYRGVADSVIWPLVGIVLCFAALWTWALYLMSRVVGCRGSLVEVETRMTRFTLFMRIYLFLAVLFVILLPTVMVVRAADYYTAHGMWWIVAGSCGLALVLCFAMIGWERNRIRELRRRLRDLREFRDA